MSNHTIIKILFLVFISSFLSCNNSKQNISLVDNSKNKESCRIVLETLLKSIENKDLISLGSTLSPKGNLEFILEGREPSYTTDAFMDLHQEWFQDTSWTMETKVLNLNVDNILATATTEGLYREPERNGKPYFNKMIVSYILEKIEGKWYMTKDQAISIEKTPS